MLNTLELFVRCPSSFYLHQNRDC